MLSGQQRLVLQGGGYLCEHPQRKTRPRQLLPLGLLHESCCRRVQLLPPQQGLIQVGRSGPPLQKMLPDDWKQAQLRREGLLWSQKVPSPCRRQVQPPMALSRGGRAGHPTPLR